MEHSLIQLTHLPNEILMNILKNLSNIDVLYALINVNQRLDAIAQDSSFTKHLTFMTHFNGSNEFTDALLNRFSYEILPKIRHEIQWLQIESLYMKRILFPTKYPNLHHLSLHDLSTDSAEDLFTNKTDCFRPFQNQLTSLDIHITDGELLPLGSIDDIYIFIYIQIFAMFKNLQRLNFSANICEDVAFTFGETPRIVTSSTLVDLRIIVKTYADCLCLLHGFTQLETFYVTIYDDNDFDILPMNNKKPILTLKRFQFTTKQMSRRYDTFLIPLLQRMTNLEELGLYFLYYNSVLINGNEFVMNVNNYLTKLKQCRFSIRSVITSHNGKIRPSNNDIQNLFKDLKNTQIITSTEYFRKCEKLHCHIYSHPYSSELYDHVNNNFRGGLFKSVVKVSLFDVYSFEHKFFVRLAQSFPSMKELHVKCHEPQHNDYKERTIIKYPHLIKLYLVMVDESYVKYFLNNDKVCLLNNIYLRVNYRQLRQATDKFRSNTTRINSSKVNKLVVGCLGGFDQNLCDYFSHAKIL